MARLVFRPYTQIWRSICTSEPLRTSTRVSPGFILPGHSSPSFGSQQMSSYSNLFFKRSVDGALICSSNSIPTSVYFHSAKGFVTLTLAHMLDSLVRVSRRAVQTHFVKIELQPRFNIDWIKSTITARERTFWKVVLSLLDPSWLDHLGGEDHTEVCSSSPNSTLRLNTSLSAISGTPLTLFSECFSSFLHSTCSLSISRLYLALDGIYHPIRAAVPSNSTLWKSVVCIWYRPRTGLSPSMARLSSQFMPIHLLT